MLPVVDKPAIQYVVEEAVAAGLTDILIITGRGKHAIEDHFDRNFELEHYLEQRGKHDLLEEVQASPTSPTSTTSASAIRSGSATRCRSRASTSATSRSRCCSPTTSWSTTATLLRSMTRRARARARVGARVARGRARGDLVVRLRRARRRSTRRAAPGAVGIVEKPPADEAPSNLAVIGRYVFTPEIFDALDRIEPGVGGELQLTDAIGLLLDDEAVFGRVFTRRPLRHRPEARLPPGQHRARARPRRPRAPSSPRTSRRLVQARGLT